MEKQIVKEILNKTDIKPRVGIVLGTGFGALAEHITEGFSVNTEEIKGYPSVRVKGHSGKMILGRLGGAEVVLFAGRPHFYEGHTTREVTLPVRIMKELGCEAVILTNAAGAINNNFRAGDFAVITDHISHNLSNPLIGRDYKFVDMCNAYDKTLRENFKKSAAEEGLSLREGVYIYFTGPSFETPAEIKMARLMGADLVGMSTVAETIAARNLGMKVLGLSYISNMAACEGEPLDHNNFVKADEAKIEKVARALKKVCINI